MKIINTVKSNEIKLTTKLPSILLRRLRSFYLHTFYMFLAKLTYLLEGSIINKLSNWNIKKKICHIANSVALIIYCTVCTFYDVFLDQPMHKYKVNKNSKTIVQRTIEDFSTSIK